MGAYEYSALDTRGKEKKGVMQGDTARQIRQLLREQGMTPMHVEAVSEDALETGIKRRRNALSAAERSLIIRQLAGLVGAALPLEEALATVAEQTEKTGSRRILVSLRSRVMEGRSLSMAMADFPRAFPELFRATIDAGEQSGRLEDVLLGLAEYAEKREDIGRGTMIALLYPAILAIVAIAVVTGLLTFVVPQVSSVFESFDAQLPLLTRILLAVSNILTQYGALILVAVGLLILGFVMAMRQPGFRRAWDQVMLRLPLIGRLMRTAETARLVRTLSILVKSSVPLLDALRISTRVVNNKILRSAVQETAVKVREGASLARAMTQTERFPPLITRLIAGGEKSGHLGDVLERAADIQEKELDTTTRVFSGILEPMLMLLVGVLVLVIVLAILLPIFQMNQLFA